MNTATGYTRVNLTIPKDIIEYLKHNTENMSRYISEALRDRITRERRDKALKTLLSSEPTFKDVKDSASYVHKIRSEDNKRDERLGIL